MTLKVQRKDQAAARKKAEAELGAGKPAGGEAPGAGRAAEEVGAVGGTRKRRRAEQ